MGILSNMVSENMGGSKGEAEAASQQRAAAATKLGGDGIERALTMKERTLSQFDANNLRDNSRDAQKQKEEQVGATTPEAKVTYSVNMTGDKATQFARDNGHEF